MSDPVADAKDLVTAWAGRPLTCADIRGGGIGAAPARHSLSTITRNHDPPASSPQAVRDLEDPCFGRPIGVIGDGRIPRTS
ncbi:MAG: hypothetical protein IRZ07_01050 [Microbispora sp.]|nr:hypothetical protein [Microbispora sp.]